MKYQTTRFLYYLVLISIGLILSSCNGGGKTEHAHTDSITTADSHATILDNQVLVPGVSAGVFKLDEPDSLVLQQLGQPDHSDAAMGKAVLLWYTDSADTYPLAVFTSRDMGNDETARIQQIRVTSPRFSTAESIHVGTPLAEIQNHYDVDQVETYGKDDKAYTVYRSAKGIAFEIGPTDSCTAIIIHHADADIATYLPLRPLG